MIVHINGPFGIGKTTAARQLVAQIPGARLYDPEIVGALVRIIMRPIRSKSDFQDYKLWRFLTVMGASKVFRRGRPLIIPMTLWRPDYFTEITAGWRWADAAFYTFRLTASEEVLERRILNRPNAEGGHDWCLSHMQTGLAAARDPAFGIEIATDDLTPTEVANTIMDHLRPTSL